MKNRALRTGLGLAAATLALPLLAACGGEDDADLVIYSGRNEQLVGPVIDAFEKESGLKVEVRYGDTAELAAQLLEEGDNTPADIFFSQDAGALGRLSDEDLLADLPAGDLDRVDARYSSAAGDWVGVTGRVRVLGYDPEQVAAAELPDDVLELAGEQWRERVAIAPTNASFQAFVTAMRVELGEDTAKEFLEDLIANDVQKYENNLAILDALESGEVAVGLLNHYYLHERRIELGAENVRTELKFLPPGTVGALINVAGVGILDANADNDSAGEFVDYLLSDEVQAQFVEATGEYPLVTGTTGPDDVPSLAELDGGAQMDLGELDSLEETVALLTEVGLI